MKQSPVLIITYTPKKHDSVVFHAVFFHCLSSNLSVDHQHPILRISNMLRIAKLIMLRKCQPHRISYRINIKFGSNIERHKTKEETLYTSTLSPYKFSLWFSLLKTCAGYLFRELQAISSANIRIILSSGMPNRFTVLISKNK